MSLETGEGAGRFAHTEEEPVNASRLPEWFHRFLAPRRSVMKQGDAETLEALVVKALGRFTGKARVVSNAECKQSREEQADR